MALARAGDGRDSRQAAHPPDLPAAAVPGRRERILIVSPHPDDETLALGGLIARARKQGTDVRVVFLTRGDGFALAAAARYRRWPGSPAMRRLAADREVEARAALGELGVPSHSLTFLGYPDRGLAELWLERWTSPYRSPYTGESQVPPGSFQPGAAYTGRSVLEDLESVLRAVRPDRVYYPDSSDDHPDHWATHCFTRMALERLPSGRRPASSATYLVHRGNWPRPLGEDERLFLAPPPELSLAIQWRSLATDVADLAAKKTALGRYQSQEALAGNFLKAFLRRNELLMQPPPPGRGGPDAIRDRWGRARWGGADFTRLEARRSGGDLLLTAQLREPASAAVSYALSWKPLLGPVEGATTRTCRLTDFRASSETARFSVHGRALTVRVPGGEVPPGPLLVGAAAWSGPVLLDRTPWWLIEGT